MITLNDLTPIDEEFIRYVVDLQIENLRALLKRESEVDVDLYCYKEEVDPDNINKSIKMNLTAFLEVKECPHILLQLDPHNLSIFRYIAVKCVRDKKYRKSRKKVWKKMLFQETYTELYYKPN